MDDGACAGLRDALWAIDVALCKSCGLRDATWRRLNAETGATICAYHDFFGGDIKYITVRLFRALPFQGHLFIFIFIVV
jgi:hypothetical protein